MREMCDDHPRSTTSMWADSIATSRTKRSASNELHTVHAKYIRQIDMEAFSEQVREKASPGGRGEAYH